MQGTQRKGNVCRVKPLPSNGSEDMSVDTNSVALVRERTIPTERPPLVGEVSAKFCGYRVLRGQRDVSLWPYSRLSRPKPLFFLPSSSSNERRLSGLCSLCLIS
jgi:hypothetical protein